MKKTELKTGMVVEVRNGDKYMCLMENIPTKFYGSQPLFINNKSFMCFDNYNENLERVESFDGRYDIIKVYQPEVASLDFTIECCGSKTLIWDAIEEERQKDKKIKQVEESIKQTEDQLLQLKIALGELRGQQIELTF